MEIIKIEKDHIDQITEIAYSTYLTEYKYAKDIPRCSKEYLCKSMKDDMFKMQGYVYIVKGNVLGYLLYAKDRSELNRICCRTPVWGYGAIGEHRETILSRLFQRIAEDVCIKENVHFVMKLYAHDESIIKLFSFLQFGIQCEEGSGFTDITIRSNAKTDICELTKQEVEQRWSEIWSILAKLIQHLQKSPVFYPGNEFTEEIYKDFFLNPDTRVYAAMENHHIIGLIEANNERNRFIGEDKKCFNVGEIYVMDEYRGQGVAQALLNYVNDSLRANGVKYIWVEHGTANPNARGFWNKYFNTYCYTMIRDIDPQI